MDGHRARPRHGPGARSAADPGTLDSHAAPSRRSPRTERCPAWCVAEHRPDDAPADEVHDSPGHLVQVTVDDDGGAHDVELLVVASRRFGSSRDWVFVGEPERTGQHLVLSAASARDVAWALLGIASRLD